MSAELLQVELPRDPSAPGRARQAARGLKPLLGEQRVQDVELLLSELVTNAVKYGGRGPVRVVASRNGGGRVRFEVIDQGEGFAARDKAADRDRGDWELEGGWGLPIVEHFADDWGSFKGSTHVWFEIAVDPAPRVA